MSLGIERFVTGQRIEVKRMKPGPGKKPMAVWEPARFSHYNRFGAPVIVLADGNVEMLADGTWLRRDDKGG